LPAGGRQRALVLPTLLQSFRNYLEARTLFFVPGALHMHTLFSDGTGTVEHLAHAARAAGLRWIIITDHDTLQGLPQAGWIDDVLVIVGHEITPAHNHFLALNVDHVIDNQLAPQDYIDAVYARGGFGINAHPDERVHNNFKGIYRWDDWSVDGPRDRRGRVAGIELWNVMSDWGEHLTPRNKELLFLRPQLGLTGPTAETLAWWDRSNMAGRRTFGVGGVDAHAFKRRVAWGEVEVFPYEWIFKTVTNYLLLDTPLSADAHIATHQVYAALVAGRLYFINRLDGICPDLTFYATRHDQRLVSGDTASISGGPLTFVADTGINAELQLIHNGQVLTRSVRKLRQSVAEPGVYRVEAHRRGRPWLYANPIYVGE
jgi:hypothetical protein